MEVTGFFSDDKRTAPFAETGDGLLVTLAVILFAYAGAVLSWFPPVQAYSVVIAVGFFAVFGGWKVRLQSGDVFDPLQPWRIKPVKRETGEPISPSEAPNWFNGLPASVVRYYQPRPILPFISVCVGPFGFYAGWKLYGFDSPEYLDFPTVRDGDVYPGSQALCKSIRFSTSRPT
jgi:hypothetical protein